MTWRGCTHAHSYLSMLKIRSHFFEDETGLTAGALIYSGMV